jgi:hypothetical protein
MKTLWLKILLLIGLVMALCLLFDAVYRSVYQQAYEPWPPLWFNRPIDQPYQIVKVGNSHAQSGITFKKYNLKGLDLSGVAQRFVFDLALLKQYSRQIDKNAVVLIPVTPISFSHRKADRNDGLQGNYYGRLAPFLIPDLKWDDYLQAKIFPFVRSGYLWRQKYADAVRDRIAEEERWQEPSPSPQAAPTSLATQSAAVVATHTFDFFNVNFMARELAHPSPVDSYKYVDNMNFIFHKWYETEEFGTQYFAGNRQDLERLIAYCLQQHWRPVLITIPVSQVLMDGLLDDYLPKYLYDNLAQTNTRGVEYLDFSQKNGIAQDMFLFGNADHLNDNGAAVFSYYLLRELIQRGYLPSAVDGYDYTPLPTAPK